MMTRQILLKDMISFHILNLVFCSVRLNIKVPQNFVTKKDNPSSEIRISRANKFVFELIGLRNLNFGKNRIGRISILINIGTLKKRNWSKFHQFRKF